MKSKKNRIEMSRVFMKASFRVIFLSSFIFVTSCMSTPKYSDLFLGQWVRHFDDGTLMIFEFKNHFELRRSSYDKDNILKWTGTISYKCTDKLLIFHYGPYSLEDYLDYEIVDQNTIKLKYNLYYAEQLKKSGYTDEYIKEYIKVRETPFELKRIGGQILEEPEALANVESIDEVVSSENPMSADLGLRVEVIDPPENQTVFDPNLSYRRLNWSGGENTFRFQVIIEKLEGEKYVEHLKGFTEKKSFDVSLLPGEYRYRVIPHDVLDRPRDGTPWMNFVIRL